VQAGLMDTYHRPVQGRGAVAWILCAALVAFYLLVYYTGFFDGPARRLGLGDKWTLYGVLYTLAMVAGGIYFLRRHGNSRYQRVRTITVVAVQVVLSFALPIVMKVLGQQEYYFSYFWPLKIEYFYPSVILQQPFLIVIYSFLASLVAVPLLGYFLGKRFYCSWICGCGGLANTAGDSFRHLSDKSPAAWRFEKASIYTVLALALVTTVIVGLNWAVGRQHPAFSSFAFGVQRWYGLVVGGFFSGCWASGSTRSWARACGAGSPVRWPPCWASCRSSRASGSR